MNAPTLWQVFLPLAWWDALSQTAAALQWPAHSCAAALLGAVLGLAVGSFLNVVVVRLPQMLAREWAEAAVETHANAANDAPCVKATPSPFNLSTPRSHCPVCGHQLSWYENIPLVSYAWLRGRCSACGVRIAWRYPLLELLTALIFGALFFAWGSSWVALAWCGFAAALVAAAVIDWDSTLLPDHICLPLLWAGLLLASWGVLPGLALHDALWGAVAGYATLASVAWGFERCTGQVGMGRGDFKLLAAIGAWLGWQSLLPVLLLASSAGVVLGLFMRQRGQLHEGRYVPFGPLLAAAALLLTWPGAQDWVWGWLGVSHGG
jgi:leader peptidase (prepilin peptidase) / N-methyltransferase